MAETSRDLPFEDDEGHADYTEFANRLNARKKEIIEEEKAFRPQFDQQNSTGGFPVDAEEMSVVDLTSDLYMRLSNQNREELIEIQEALDRMRTGKYGYCERCGDPIQLKRLRARPYARFCLDCQVLQEREAQARNLNPTPPKL